MSAFYWFLRILWTCRVSVLSALAGLLMFGLTVPAQNLMEDLSFSTSAGMAIVFWGAVFVATFVMWAFPIHYGARLTLEDDAWILSRSLKHELPKHERDHLERSMRRNHSILITHMPRVLGIMPFVALGLGIVLGALANKGAVVLPEGQRTIQQAYWLFGADVTTAIAFYIFVTFRRPVIARHFNTPRAVEMLKLFTRASIVVTTAFFALAYFCPIVTSAWWPRALLVPPLFGSLVLILSLLQRYAHLTGVPALFMVAVVATTITAINTSFHDIRTVTRSGGDGRWSVKEALDTWKAANACDHDCRPLIIAIDGGASRSAFTAATFVGKILDGMDKPSSSEAMTPGRRIFALSGVSGGSFGAAVIQAALADSQAAGSGMTSPCHTAHRTWFGYGRASTNDGVFSWRECLQALTSGDSLSPTIIGLAFRDAVAPRIGLVSGPSIEDRAALIEESFERHFQRTVDPAPWLLSIGDVCGRSDVSGLCRRIGHPDAFVAGHPKGNRWMPLLLLNGTSVGTGRRIIASDLKSVPSATDPGTGKLLRGSLYPQAFDLAEAMSSPCPGDPPPPPHGLKGTEPISGLMNKASQGGTTVRSTTHGVCASPPPLDGPDIRLSTAILSSARFPIISPAGTFEMGASKFGDHLVDGGYFENSGITTALDLVNALRDVDPTIKPLLLSIANDPQEDKIVAGVPRRPSETPLVVVSQNTWPFRVFGLIEAPALALAATRDGHAAEALGSAETMLGPNSLFRLGVKAEADLSIQPADPADPSCAKLREDMKDAKTTLKMTKVSMSWWLSASVQADIDAQRCDAGNSETITALLAALKRL